MARTKLWTTLGMAALSLLAFSTTASAAAPWVGIVFQRTSGSAVVDRTVPTSPARKAGLRRGDVVTQVDGQAVASGRAVSRITRRSTPGRTMRFTITRGGRSLVKVLRVAKAPSEGALLRLYWLNQRAPNFYTKLINRPGTLKLSSLRGKPVILYFWASWCDSCKINFGKLKRLHQAWSKRGLVIYSMSEDKRTSQTVKTLGRLKLPFDVGHNKRKFVSGLYKFDKIPVLIGIDRKGVVRDLLMGSSYSYGRLQRLVRKIK